NHSLCKTMAFFTAGKLGQQLGTNDLRKYSGMLAAAPLWGMGLLASLLALIGLAPFALFMSELQLVRAAIQRQAVATVIVFLTASSVVFVGALHHAISAAWG